MGDHLREGGHFADVCVHLLGVFTKLRKATISFVILSVCPSVRPHGTTLHPLDGVS